MFNTRTMFPSKRSEPDDFHELFPGGTVLTIDRVEDRRNQDEESYFVLYFKELLRPISLNKTNARTISDLVGSDETADWNGFQVRLMCIPIEVPGDGGAKQMKLGFRVFKKSPAARPELENKSDLSILLATKKQAERRIAAQNEGRNQIAGSQGIGIDRAIKMMYLLKQRGKDWQFVVDHFTNSLKMGEQISAVAKPPDLPESMAALIGGIVKSFPITTQVDAAEHEAECRALWTPSIKGEVIDPKTGEVIDMNDIPF